MSETIKTNHNEVDEEAKRLRCNHEYSSKGLANAEDVNQRAQALRDQIAQSSDPENDFSYEERVFANGEIEQTGMLRSAELYYRANMWEAQEHYRDNMDTYVDLAKRDAEAAGVHIETSETK